jgi:hypothetical protein
MDTFWTMVALLAIACALNVRKGKSTEVRLAAQRALACI